MNKARSSSKTRILVALGASNLAAAFVIGIVASLIEILNYKHGLIILGAIVVGSIGLFAFRVFVAQRNYIEQLEAESTGLRERLRQIVLEIRIRSPANPRPMRVNIWISTQRHLASRVQVQALDVRSHVIEIDKGTEDYIIAGMYFATYEKASGQALETNEVEYADAKRAWLTHSGTKVNGLRPSDLAFRCVEPPGILPTEKNLGDIILLAEKDNP